MKKFSFLIAIIVFTCLSALGQKTADLIVFSEDAERFYVFINGEKQNLNAETNVKVKGVTPNISLRIEFENKTLPAIKQMMALEPGFEHTARIKRDKNQQLKLRYFGQVPLAETHSENVPSVNYHTAENIATDNNINQSANNTDDQVSVTSTTVTSHTNSGSSTSPASVSINMPGVNIAMNDSQNSNQVRSSASTTVTQVTTTRSPRTNSASTSVTTAPVGCSAPMSTAAFTKMKQTIESKPFSDTKMSTAKVATKSACLSINQVKEICKLFSMDDDKLAYAKYAYNSCVDKTNYYQVSEVFAFSATTEDFNRFLDK